MNKYSICDNKSGKITKRMTCDKKLISLQLSNDEFYIQGDYDDSLYYISLDDLSVKNKPDLPVTIDKSEIQADGLDIVTINNLPISEPNGNTVSTFIEVAGQVHEITDGIFEFTTDLLGTYIFICKATNYLNKEFIVEAV